MLAIPRSCREVIVGAYGETERSTVGMRIEHIDVVNLNVTHSPPDPTAAAGGVVTGRLTSLVRVTADNGVTGIGTAYSHPDLVKIVVENHLQPFLVGKDAGEVEALWDLMYQLTRWYGRKGVAISALGAVDTALWDLRGKALEKPVFELLGAERSAVPAYASGLLWYDDLAELQDTATSYLEEGFTRVKMRLGRNESYDTAAIPAVRKAIGPDRDVMVDASQRYSLDVAERIAEILAANQVFWFEEPFAPEDIDSYVALRPRVSVPVAAGENDFGFQGFREMLRAGALDIVQPDVSRAGGITECLRIGHYAAEMDVGVATHTWSDAIAFVANAHVVASLSNGITVEIDRTGNPLVDELLAGGWTVRNGLLELSDAPGLGIEVDPAALERYALPASEMVVDGNYADLKFGPQYWTALPDYETDPG